MSETDIKSVVLLDLGGTLVDYYSRQEIPQVLEEAITEVEATLRRRRRLCVPPELVRARVAEENCETRDCRVRPLERRLARIFDLGEGGCDEALCRSFLKPIFARARRFDDTLPTLRRLRAAGLRLGLVSNTSWGSPGILWREELRRHGLDGLLEAAVFCTDVGWRKPAAQIYSYALERLGARPETAVFVGDDRRWDYDGPRSVGIEAVLLDRDGMMEDLVEDRVRDLDQFCAWVSGRRPGQH